MLTELPKKSFLIMTLGFFVVLVLGGCRKSLFEERIEGDWQVVNVTDIDPSQGELWRMQSNNLSIYRYNKANPDNRWLQQQGKYVIERRDTRIFLKLANLNYTTFNTSWEIFRLTKNQLVISIEVPGGIFYKEFVRKTGN